MMFDRVASRSKTRSKLNELRFHSLEFLLGFCVAAGRGSSLTERERERARINNNGSKGRRNHKVVLNKFTKHANK